MISDIELLKKYLPEKSVEQVFEWIKFYKIRLKITKQRSTKLGDYRPPILKPFHQISVNYNLNSYSFLLTLTHEIAHLIVWEKFKNKVKPHGNEWKQEFKLLMKPFVQTNIFPPDLHQVIINYLKNAKASSGSDLELTRQLRTYDKNNHSTLILEDLPIDSIFRINNGMKFKKGEKLRKRYACICLNNNKKYLINPLADVMVE